MNEPQVFSYEQTQVRTIMIDGGPWFVGKDVAEALGYADTVNALKAHVDDEDKRGWRITTPSRGEQEMTIINESGVYSLIFSSKLEGAKRFKHWVTHEVLPSIRKTGAYIPQKPAPELPAPRVATAKRILARCGEIQEEIIPDRPETKLKAMKHVKKLLEDNDFNAPAIVVDPASHSEESDLDMVDFIFDQPKGEGVSYDDYLASLLMLRSEPI